MERVRWVIGLLVIPASLASLGIATPLYDAALIALAIGAFWALSPTRILFGARDAAADAAISPLAGLLLAGDAARIIGSGLLAIRVLAPIGLAGIVAVSVWLSRSRVPQRGGALWALRQRGEPGPWRDAVTAILFLLLAAAVLRPLLLLARSTAASPLLGLAIVAVLLAWRLPHAPVLMSPVGVLLAVAGTLLLRFAIETVPSLLLSLPDHPWSPAFLPIAASALGTLAIVIVPLAMWRTLLALRATRDHAHLPDWPEWLVSVTIGLMAMALLAPVVRPVIDGAGVALAATQPGTGRVAIAAGIALAAWIIALANDRARRILMAIPYLAGTVAVCAYAFVAFAASFLSSGSTIVFAAQNGWYPAIVAEGVVFAVSGLALILGACGLVYEIARD